MLSLQPTFTCIGDYERFSAHPEPECGLILFPLALAQPRSGAATVLVDELDAAGFECPPDHVECCAAGLTYSCFELVHSHYSDARFPRESLLAPTKEASRSPALCRCNHRRTVAESWESYKSIEFLLTVNTMKII